jgi:hypothetical protein
MNAVFRDGEVDTPCRQHKRRNRERAITPEWIRTTDLWFRKHYKWCLYRFVVVRGAKKTRVFPSFVVHGNSRLFSATWVVCG